MGGFEHPSEVQHECIPQAILGMDVICQAKSGMGKTAVFVLSSLHQLEAKEGQVGAIVLCHTRELAFQINNEFERFSRYLPDVKVKVFYGGVPVPEHKRILKSECPHIIVGTPGRIRSWCARRTSSPRTSSTSSWTSATRCSRSSTCAVTCRRSSRAPRTRSRS